MSFAKAIAVETEAGLQEAVIALAKLRGWRVAHFRPARTEKGWRTPVEGDAGFPDLVLVRDGRLIFAELKSQRGKVTLDQHEWLHELSRVGGVEARVRPPGLAGDRGGAAVNDGVPDFAGDVAGYVAWRDEHPQPFNPHWCTVHWAPCPVEGRNGIMATVLIIAEAFAFVPSNIKAPHALNSWFENQTTPTCCKLGDQKMSFLWELVRRVDNDEVCGDNRNVPKGRHSCFYAPGHGGPHEHQRPPESVFALMDGAP